MPEDPFVPLAPAMAPQIPQGSCRRQTAAFVLMVTVWLNGYGFLIARAATRFGPRIRRALDGVAGAVMVGLGVRLAVERR